MTKKDFAKKYALNAGLSISDAERKMAVFLETVEEVLVAGDEVNFIGWGKWEVVERAERLGRNPKTGEEMKIAAKKTVKFKAGKKLNEVVK